MNSKQKPVKDDNGSVYLPVSIPVDPTVRADQLRMSMWDSRSCLCLCMNFCYSTLLRDKALMTSFTKNRAEGLNIQVLSKVVPQCTLHTKTLAREVEFLHKWAKGYGVTTDVIRKTKLAAMIKACDRAMRSYNDYLVEGADD